MTTVILPDVSVRLVAKFLRLIYTGSTFISSKTETEEIGNFAENIFGFSFGFESSVSLEPVPDSGRDKDCDDFSIEDCSVAPPICIYLGQDGKDQRFFIFSLLPAFLQMVLQPLISVQTGFQSSLNRVTPPCMVATELR